MCLRFQHKNCIRITNENKLLKVELKDAQEYNDYAQNVMNAFKSERQLKLHSLTIPEVRTKIIIERMKVKLINQIVRLFHR